MTESEWLACTDPKPMLEHLQGRASERKLRLMTVAAARSLGEYLPESELRATVEAAERSADGLMSVDELESVARPVYPNYVRPVAFDPERASRWRDGSDPRLSGILLVLATAYSTRRLAQLSQGVCWRSGAAGVAAGLPGWVRDIFGNPFRPATADPRWLTSTVVALAQTTYDDRAYDRLPILADALEDSNCNDAEVLAHCRGPGPHVRGCWVVDSVLGKQ